ncbi:hypothetical protein PSTT_05572 [Puccinia striiformis]|uniref:Uncharacterized protein n=1 Tax=Puccinia striiformis TaxID=27350 RepID=A0A2S4VNC4_9BASI|nr:hypothetical protein PSTT_05572 [Puccinia striiformis]
MVVTRRLAKTTKEQLFGPLPPPTRRREGPTILERQRKLQLRQLSKLPPLPLSPPPTPPQQPNTHIDPDTSVDNINQALTRLQLTTHNPIPAPSHIDQTSCPSDLDNRPPSPLWWTDGYWALSKQFYQFYYDTHAGAVHEIHELSFFFFLFLFSQLLLLIYCYYHFHY